MSAVLVEASVESEKKKSLLESGAIQQLNQELLVPETKFYELLKRP